MVVKLKTAAKALGLSALAAKFTNSYSAGMDVELETSPETQQVLNDGVVPPLSNFNTPNVQGNTSAVAPSNGGALGMTNAEMNRVVRAGPASILDLQTGREYKVFLGGAPGAAHIDFTPLTTRDTSIMKSLANGWSWGQRPSVLTIQNGTRIAVAVHTFPHGSIIGGSPGPLLNNFPNNASHPNSVGANGGIRWARNPHGGHMCLYGIDSRGGTRGMREAAGRAVGR